MATELGLFSITQIRNLSQSQYSQHNQNQQKVVNPKSSSFSSWNMSNSNELTQEEDDSWEVRAFAEDTRNIMGSTWPPRSYTCTFCRREFHSAQALGGHMNVHRRDRARLHQQQPSLTNPNHSPTSPFIIPAQEFVANGGLCLFYQLPTDPNCNTFSTTTPTTPCVALNAYINSSSSPSSSTLLSISPLPTSVSFPATPLVASGMTGPTHTVHKEELDLELRLGQSRPTHS